MDRVGRHVLRRIGLPTSPGFDGLRQNDCPAPAGLLFDGPSAGRRSLATSTLKDAFVFRKVIASLQYLPAVRAKPSREVFSFRPITFKL
jgi:hypothetical protein